jgi:hypothetical protein|uniref:Uncharacterized protein n=1 Tax=viral metagenome TaxID=1070528 RepID=A0A6C0H0Y0_9ZZZZ
MINKLITSLVEHLSTEIQNNNKIEAILKPILTLLYSKIHIYINVGISLYFLLLFICILNLILLLFKN